MARIGYLTEDQFAELIKPEMAVELDDTFQPLDATLTALAGLAWTAGAQIGVFTAADTVEMRSIGAASATDILDRAAGDTRYIEDAEKGAANGVATLDASSKIPSAQLPGLALTDVHSVSSEAAMLALTAQEGDIAIRTDINKTFAHNGGAAGTVADWSELLSPTDSVTSVNGETGAVTLTADDIGSTATGGVAATTVQAAIAELDTDKAAVSHTHAIADVTGLQTALDGKVDDSQISAFGLTLVDDADAATARGTLGLAIGTDVQAWDADLDATASSGLASAWTSYTPTATSSGGTITSYTASGGYMKLGKTVFFRAFISVSDNGTGSGSIAVSLPFTSATYFAMLGSNPYTSKLLSVTTGPGSTSCTVVVYDGTYPVASGQDFYINGVYQTSA